MFLPLRFRQEFQTIRVIYMLLSAIYIHDSFYVSCVSKEIQKQNICKETNTDTVIRK